VGYIVLYFCYVGFQYGVVLKGEMITIVVTYPHRTN